MENRCGLPWAIVRKYKGGYGSTIDCVDHIDFDKYSVPRKDAHGWWIFSLKRNGNDVCMIRCWGTKAKEYAIGRVNSILDEKEGV